MGTSTAQQTWYLAWVRHPAAFHRTPVGEQFSSWQVVHWRRLGTRKWLVFDGTSHYLVLGTAEATAALKACRDATRQPVPSGDQRAVWAQFTAATRLRSRRKCPSSVCGCTVSSGAASCSIHFSDWATAPWPRCSLASTSSASKWTSTTCARRPTSSRPARNSPRPAGYFLGLRDGRLR